MAIYPIDICVELLIKNSTLRLYGLPCSSQLLKRLGRDWSSATEVDLPLPCLPARNCPAHSHLTELANLVPTHSPRLLPHALLPWNLRGWDDRLTQAPQVRHGEDRKRWVTSLKAENGPQ
jgi:hypothetical protein